MNGIEKISNRLVADAEAEIAALNADAKEKCDAIRAEYSEKAQAEYQSRMSEGVKAAETRLQRLGSAAEMEAKKSILAFKQEMVAKAFDDAAEKLANLPREQYVQFLASQAAAAAATGAEELIFNERDKAAVGAVGDIGCYGLDFALNSIGYPKPLTVSAKQFAYFGKNPKKYAEADRFTVDDDFAVAMIRCEGDIVIDYRASWAMNMDTTGDSLFFGTDAGLKVKAPVGCCWDGAAGDLILYQDDKDGKQTATEIKVEGNNVKMGMFESKIRAFVDACLTGGPAPIPTSQIIYNQAIIDGIIRSNACGHEVTIDL